MKKSLKILITIVFAMCAVLSGLSVRAEILPVKKAWILSKICTTVLREDGTLLIADSIEAEQPEFVVNNVADFVPYANIGLGVDKGKCRGVILYQNGEVATLQWNGTASEYEINTVADNAKEIYSFEWLSLAYIDNNDVLKGYWTSPIDNYTISMENVKCCYESDGTSAAPIRVITLDDRLCELDIEDNTVNEIMTNVKDIKPANRDLLILRNNGDLYLYKKGETPNRIGMNVEDMSKVTFRDTWTAYGIEYVNKNGEYFSGSSTTEMKKCMDNVKEIYRGVDNDNKYVLTNENFLYCFPFAVDLANKSATVAFNVKKMLGEDYFVLGTDNKVYVNKNINRKGKYITDDVREVIVYDRQAGTDDDRYLFIKNDGTLYGAYASDNFVPNELFLTSFCQKPTKVIINDKNVELTAKIQFVNDRSMYPFRECLENMGASVLWDSTNRIAIGEYNGITIEFPIDKSEYWINGVKYEMDTKSYIDSSLGRTYIPIRYAAEGLGFKVDWESKENENIISISK